MRRLVIALALSMAALLAGCSSAEEPAGEPTRDVEAEFLAAVKKPGTEVPDDAEILSAGRSLCKQIEVGNVVLTSESRVGWVTTTYGHELWAVNVASAWEILCPDAI